MTREGRSVLVTGATSGIGLEVARTIAHRGDHVYLCGRDGGRVAETVEKLCADGHTVDGTTCDVRDPEQITHLVAAAADRFGPTEILVNNAGRTGGGNLPEITDDLWHDVLTTNLTSAFLLTRAVVASMCAAGWGRVVNIASTAGKQGVLYATPYSASKHGVVGFTKAAAQELAPHGVTVNAVCPGYVETPMAQRVRVGFAEHWGITEQDVLTRFNAKIPLGRYSTPQEVAGLVGYLTTETAGSITAQAMNVCGGLGNY
ncbi:3-oxoacyl-ACP reductase FabG [Nocardia nova]|uniref:3-oxoacyl-ACP reductase FabG n=1 Tax=Nocardia nova TaxID=37330 RepID=UPI0033F05ED5